MSTRLCTVLRSAMGGLTTPPNIILGAVGAMTLLPPILGVLILALYHPSPPPPDPTFLSLLRDIDDTQCRIARCGERLTEINSLIHEDMAVVSWYGEPFHGRLTASGIRYNMESHQAASMTLPMGTIVVLFRGDRASWVVITDRGDFAKYGRDLDVSRLVMRELGGLKQGVVTCDVLIYRGNQKDGGAR